MDPDNIQLVAPQVPGKHPEVTKTPQIILDAQEHNRTKMFLALIPFTILMMVLMTFLGLRLSNNQSTPAPVANVTDESDRSVSVSLTDLGDSIGSSDKVTINGDFEVKKSIRIGSFDSDFYGEILTDTLTANRTYTLPDQSGEICLDTNNCGFSELDQEDLDQIQSDVENNIDDLVALTLRVSTNEADINSLELTVSEISSDISGLELRVEANEGNISLNSIAISTNQTNISTNTTNIATNTAAIAALALSSGDINNGGNSFGSAITIGTNDNFNLELEVNNNPVITVYPIASSGAVGIGEHGTIEGILEVGESDFGSNFSGAGISGAALTVGTFDSVTPAGSVGIAAISADNSAIIGVSNSNSGSYYWNEAAVAGINTSNDGYGVVGVATSLGGGTGVGVYGVGGSYGVHAISTDSSSLFVEGGCSGLFSCTPSTAPLILVEQYSDATTNDILNAQNSSGTLQFAIEDDGELAWGSTRDTNLYRTAANVLQTDDSLVVSDRLQIGIDNTSNSISQCQGILLYACSVALEIELSSTETANRTNGILSNISIDPASDNSADNYGMASYLNIDSINDYTGTNTGGILQAAAIGTGSVSTLIGVQGNAGTSNATVSTAAGVVGSVFQLFGSGSIDDGYALYATNSVGTVDNAYGLYIEDQNNAATNNYGISIAGADTYALWVGSGQAGTTAADGISFGNVAGSADTNLYRGGNDLLQTDDDFLVAGDIYANNKLLQTITGDPTHEGSITDDVTTVLSGANDVVVRGNYAYVTSFNEDGLQIIDISDPANPQSVGQITDSGPTELDGAWGVDVVGNYAYVTGFLDSGLEIIDVSDPTNPAHVGALNDDGTTTLSFPRGIKVVGKYAYVASLGESGLAIIDISDPSRPTQVGSITDNVTTELAGATNVDVVGNYAYVTGYSDNGVEIVDISDPTSPTHAGAINDDLTTELFGAWDITVNEKYAYVTARDDDGLEILDISDPSSPTHVGSITDDGTTALGYASNIKHAGNYVFITSNTEHGLEIIDVSNPASPTHVGAIYDDGTTALSFATGIDIKGNYVFVTSNGDSGLEIIDIGGSVLSTASIGALTVTNVQVDQELVVKHNINALNGLNVGRGGINSVGDLSTEGKLRVVNSADIGIVNDVTGSWSLAVGAGNTVSGDESLAVGDGNNVAGVYSGALGSYNDNQGNNSSWTIGDSNDIISGSTYGIAIGYGNQIDTDYGYAFGSGNVLNSFANTGLALGDGNTINANSAWALGYQNTTDGNLAGAIGQQNTSSAVGSIAIGYNLELDSSANYSIGLNLDGTARTVSTPNVFTVTGGNAGIGTLAPNRILEVAAFDDTISFESNPSSAIRVTNTSTNLAGKRTAIQFSQSLGLTQQVNGMIGGEYIGSGSGGQGGLWFSVYNNGAREVATLDNNGAFVLTNYFDTTSGFVVNDSDGGNPVLNVDTANERVGIGTATPTLALDVVGSTTISDRLQVGVTNTIGQCTGILGPVSCDAGIDVENASVETINDTFGIRNAATIDPVATNTADNYGIYNSINLNTTNDYSGENYAGYFTGGGTGSSGTISSLVGVGSFIGHFSLGSSQTITSASALQAQVGIFELNVAPGATITSAFGLQVLSADNDFDGDTNASTITNNYGIHVQDQSDGTNDYGLAIDGADTYALWVGSGGSYTDSANGISFGNVAGVADTNIYRNGADVLRTDDDFLSARLAVNATSFGTDEQFRVNTPTVVDNDAVAVISSGATDQTVLVIQAVASQTAALQEWQDSTGAVVATVYADGGLYVQDTTIDGDLELRGHITAVNNAGGSTTVAAGAGAGTGPTVSVTGSDVAGYVSITTGTSSGTGTLATITFANAYGGGTIDGPSVVLTPKNGNGSTIQYYAATTNKTTFTIDTNNAPTDSTTYEYYYHVIHYDNSD